MIAKDDRKNAEGYNDPTAYNAIKNVEQEQDDDDYGRITESVRNFGRGVEQSFGADGETG